MDQQDVRRRLGVSIAIVNLSSLPRSDFIDVPMIDHRIHLVPGITEILGVLLTQLQDVEKRFTSVRISYAVFIDALHRSPIERVYGDEACVSGFRTCRHINNELAPCGKVQQAAATGNK